MNIRERQIDKCIGKWWMVVCRTINDGIKEHAVIKRCDLPEFLKDGWESFL